jgi:hypothetical protein
MTCLLSDEMGDEINGIKNLTPEHADFAEKRKQKILWDTNEQRKKCLKFEMPKMPKVKTRALSPLTPSSELKTPNFFGTRMNTDKHG